MTSRKLSSILFIIIVIVVINIFSKNTDNIAFQTIQKLSPASFPVISQKDVVLGATGSAEPKQTVIVTKVIDGDTIEIEGGQKVRYIGIDTPETKHPTKGVQCFGKKASEKNKELVEGKGVILEKDISETDRYGRLLRFVYIDGVFVNDYLVREGYAHASTYPPDVKFAQQFRQAEQQARTSNKGLWIDCKK